MCPLFGKKGMQELQRKCDVTSRGRDDGERIQVGNHGMKKAYENYRLITCAFSPVRHALCFDLACQNDKYDPEITVLQESPDSTEEK
jgi:hypothetical protein